MLKSRRFWLGLAMSTIFVGFFLYRVDVRQLAMTLAQANYLYAVPGVACYFVSLWFRTLRWQLVMRPLGRLRATRLWPVMAVGYAANNILPVRLGELVRAYYVGEREGVSKVSALATILVERVFDGVALLFLVAAVSLFIPVVGLFQGLGQEVHINWLVLTLGLSIPFFAITGLLIIVAMFPVGVERFLPRALIFLPPHVRPRAVRVVLNFLEGLGALRSPGRLLAIFALSIPVWLAEAIMYFIIAFGFGIDEFFPNWGFMAGVLVLTTATSNLGTSVPSTGGGIGPFEFFTQATLMLFGVRSDVASAYAIALHVFLLAPVTLLGLIYLWLADISLARLATASQGGDPSKSVASSRLEGGSGP